MSLGQQMAEAMYARMDATARNYRHPKHAELPSLKAEEEAVSAKVAEPKASPGDPPPADPPVPDTRVDDPEAVPLPLPEWMPSPTHLLVLAAGVAVAFLLGRLISPAKSPCARISEGDGGVASDSLRGAAAGYRGASAAVSKSVNDVLQFF